MSWDESYDFVIIGSGAGAVSAALAVKEAGKSALIIEKQARFGGSTAYSGGVLWIPNNYCLGRRDTPEKAALYLDSLLGDVGPASSPARRQAFIKRGTEMIDFLRRHGMKFKHAHWPDYYSDEAGGLAEGRSLISPMFDVNRLGEWRDRLARFDAWPDVPIAVQEFRALGLAKRTWKGRFTALRVGMRMAFKKATGKLLRGSGNAIQGRLLEIALRERVPILLSTPAQDLITEGDRVTGVLAEHDGKQIRIEARLGVLINAGGFSRNKEMRDLYQPKPIDPGWTLANPGDTGEMIRAGMQLGAAVDLMNEAWWLPASMKPDGSFGGLHVPSDAGKPHVIIVDSNGNRIGNEANAYMEFGQKMFAAHAVPAWAIIESRHRRNYPWGSARPGNTPEDWLESGYMKRADTIEELARLCGIDAAGLRATVDRFNGFARVGRDDDFKRGYSAYNRYNGDSSHRPNACLGTIEKPPYYAVAIYPSDVGTAGGLLTDEYARVLRQDGSAITNLYATGNSTASVMGRHYPGAGASIGASFTFGYIAALHACGSNR